MLANNARILTKSACIAADQVDMSSRPDTYIHTPGTEAGSGQR